MPVASNAKRRSPTSDRTCNMFCFETMGASTLFNHFEPFVFSLGFSHGHTGTHTTHSSSRICTHIMHTHRLVKRRILREKSSSPYPIRPGGRFEPSNRTCCCFTLNHIVNHTRIMHASSGASMLLFSQIKHSAATSASSMIRHGVADTGRVANELRCG